MKPRSLIEAALLDQERRILQAEPLELVKAKTGPKSRGRIKCSGGCGAGQCPSNAPSGSYTCNPCRLTRRRPH